MTTRCNLITGFLGAGKTTLIRHLLSQRPEGERWAVIVNEFGVVGIDGTTLAAAGSGSSSSSGSGSGSGSSSDVTIREVAGGCICCAANVPLRVAITDVLRRVRPDRLLVEPSGLGHPAAILATLAEPGLAKALTIGAVVCVADARHPVPGDGQVAHDLDDTWRDQLAMADVVVVNKRDLVDDTRYAAFVEWIESLYPPRQAVVSTVEGRMPAALLDLPRARWRPALAGARGHHPGATSVQAPPRAIPGLGTRHVARSGTTGSVGWLFDDPERQATVFDADRIDRMVVRLDGTLSASDARLLRAKGALRTNQGARLVEWSASHVRSSPLTFAGPGRFELLFESATDEVETVSSTVAEALESLLQDALVLPPEH